MADNETTLSREVLAKLKIGYEEAELNASKTDPPTEPYKSKYEARKKLQELISLADESGHGDDSKALMAHFLARLGSIDHEVEELAKSEEDLKASLAKCDDVTDQGLVIIPLLVSLNQLGILWSSRADFAKAQSHLDQALSAYTKFKSSQDNKKIYDVHDLLDPNDACPEDSSKEKALETLNMHSCYYLAQVYEKTGQQEKSATFCHLTLTMQLALKQYNPVEWATNAYTLSHYYLVRDNFQLAKHHIAAARFILDQNKEEIESGHGDEGETGQEVFQRTSARIDRAWGMYCSVLLGKSHDKYVTNPNGGEELAIVNVEEDEDLPDEGLFPSIEVDSLFNDIPTKFAYDFENARAIFLPGQRFLNKAKEYFKLEEHCSDYVEMNQDLSIMHKYLANYEQDLDRRFKIHKRRIDLLEKPLQELNEKFYLLLCRKLIYELAEIYESMMDAKMDKIKASKELPTNQTIVKVNKIICSSIDYFNRYLDTFKDSDGKLPDTFATENARPVLIAYFHLGRLWDKYLVPEPSEQKLQNKVKCFAYHKMFVEYCDLNPGVTEMVADELAPCRELVKLLPIKIERMKQELSHVRNRDN